MSTDSSPAINERLVQRAIDAYLSCCRIDAPLPSSADSGVVREGRKRYVVLRRIDRILAVYRIYTGGTLTQLERTDYPRSLEMDD
jgi:hypothetical protein